MTVEQTNSGDLTTTKVDLSDLNSDNLQPGIVIEGMQTIESVGILARAVGNILVSKGSSAFSNSWSFKYMYTKLNVRNLSFADVIKEKAAKENFRGLLRNVTATVLPPEYEHGFRTIRPDSNIVSLSISAEAHSSAGQLNDMNCLCVFEHNIGATVRVHTKMLEVPF